MDFLYKKHPKGTYEYADHKKLMDAMVMVIMFALALGLYIIGIVTTGSKKNLLTIVAVLGLLPACKMVVSLIMSLRVRPCDKELRTAIDGHVGDLAGFYNMYFTSYDKNFFIDHLVISGKSIIGLCTSDKFDEKVFDGHLSELIRKEGIKDAFIKVFTDKDKYINRLVELNGLGDEDKAPNNELRNLIMNVTL